MPTKPQFFRFRDLDPAAINVDFQVHTVQTDGEGTIAEILERAEQCGLRAIAFTEHVRKSTDWFASFAQAVRTAALEHPELIVHVGCETKADDLDGSLDVSPAILEQCDIVLGSVHRFPDRRGGYLDFAALAPDDVAQIEFDLSMGMLRSAPIDVLSHPGGMYQRRHGAYPEELYRDMMKASLERDIAIEINTSYLVDVAAFLRLCDEINPLVSVGSDVHRVEDLGKCRDLLASQWIAA